MQGSGEGLQKDQQLQGQGYTSNCSGILLNFAMIYDFVTLLTIVICA